MPLNNNRRFAGFTLVELLVVISIIATLLAVLMPALKKAREQGRRTICATNEKSLMMGTQMYMRDDAFYRFPYQNAGNGSYTGSSEICWMIEKALDSRVGKLNPNWAYALLSGKFVYQNGMLSCPNGQNGGYNNRNIEQFKMYITYMANGILTHFGGKKVKCPSALVSYQERPRTWTYSAVAPHYQGHVPTETQALWTGWMVETDAAKHTDEPHFGGENLAFLDGHVDFQRASEITSMDFGLLIKLGVIYMDTYEQEYTSYSGRPKGKIACFK